ncbi:hypothetical protein D3C80_126820 [compost metagenome]
MERYVIADAAGAVVNVTQWDGETEWSPGEGLIVIRSDEAQIGWTYGDGVFTPPPAAEPTGPFRVSKSRFGELFTDDENRTMNLIRWQTGQMDAAERAVPTNPLVYAETMFRKFDLPAEFIELDLPMVADGLGLLGMLGVFGDDAAIRIPQILSDELPSSNGV